MRIISARSTLSKRMDTFPLGEFASTILHSPFVPRLRDRIGIGSMNHFEAPSTKKTRDKKIQWDNIQGVTSFARRGRVKSKKINHGRRMKGKQNKLAGYDAHNKLTSRPWRSPYRIPTAAATPMSSRGCADSSIGDSDRRRSIPPCLLSRAHPPPNS
jgi:hypothetical protein